MQERLHIATALQLPLALDKILAGESPYGADYSDSILGKEAPSVPDAMRSLSARTQG